MKQCQNFYKVILGFYMHTCSSIHIFHSICALILNISKCYKLRWNFHRNLHHWKGPQEDVRQDQKLDDLRWNGLRLRLFIKIIWIINMNPCAIFYEIVSTLELFAWEVFALKRKSKMTTPSDSRSALTQMFYTFTF